MRFKIIEQLAEACVSRVFIKYEQDRAQLLHERDVSCQEFMQKRLETGKRIEEYKRMGIMK